MRDLFHHSVAMLRNPKLVALHLVVNAALLTAAIFWLLIPEAHVWQLLFAALSALLILFVFLWLHSSTLAYAADPAPAKFRAAFSIKIGRRLWFLIGFGSRFWCVRTVDGWSDSVEQISGYIYSGAPDWLRPTAGDSGYTAALGYLFSIVQWYVLPCVFLPVIAARVAGGSSLRGLRTLGRWQYWLGMAVTSLLGVWVTSLIVGWTPGRTLSQQTVSLVIRLVLAYAIATAAWLAAAGLVGYFVGPECATKSVPLDGLWDRLVPAGRAFWDRLVPPGGEGHSIIHHCLAVIRDRRMVVLQLVACIVMAATSRVSTDTLVDLERIWKLVVAIIGGLLLLAAFLWSYSSTLVYAADPAPGKFRSAFRFGPRRMAWLLAGLVVLLVSTSGSEYLLWMLNGNDRYFWLLLHVTRLTSGYLLPCLVLPWIAVKVVGKRLREGLRPLRCWRYWAGMVLVIYLAQWVSDQLSIGRLETGSLWTELMGTIWLALADLPLIVGWVLVAGLLGYFVGTRDDGAPANVVGKAAP